MRRFLLLAAALVAINTAHAQPPAGTDPNTPEAKWYRGLAQPKTGYGCCSIADCRPVPFRQESDHYVAYITVATFFPNWHPGSRTPAPVQDGWYPVPDSVVIRDQPNPTGEAVACWYAN